MFQNKRSHILAKHKVHVWRITVEFTRYVKFETEIAKVFLKYFSDLLIKCPPQALLLEDSRRDQVPPRLCQSLQFDLM